MSRVLDEIVQEVESKAPVLKRQREEYESMQRSMTSLCNKLEQARMVWETSYSICVCQCVHLFTFDSRLSIPARLNMCLYFPLSLGDLQFAKRKRRGEAAP